MSLNDPLTTYHGHVDAKVLRGRQIRIVDVYTGRHIETGVISWVNDATREICEYVFDADGNPMIGADDMPVKRIRRAWIKIIIEG